MIVPLGPGDPNQLGPFTLSGRIGEGGQGVVYLGVNEAGEQVAIKLLHIRFTGDAIARSRFARELRAAQRVASFCTARVMAADLEGDTPYIASEFIDGPSLRDTVESSGPLRGVMLERLAVGTATALTAIHQAGIVHRDFKPDNVLLAADGPRVVDFGIARIIDSTGTITSRAVGTPAYMAPEQISGDAIGPATDVFAWGATIAYAATGKAAFGGDSIAAVLNRVLNHDIDVSELPEPLRGVVQASLAKASAARPTADQLLLRLLGRTDVGGASTVVLTEGAHIANPETGPIPRINHASGPPPPLEARIGPGVPVPPTLLPARPKRRWIPAAVAVGAAVAVIAGVAYATQALDNSGVGPSPSVTVSALVPTTAPPSPTAYASVFDKAAATGKLVVGVRDDLPNLSLSSQGFEVEVAKYIARKLGVPAEGVTFRTVSRFTRAEALKTGQVDLVVATYSYDDYKNDEVTFAGPYYVARTDVLVREDAGIDGVGALTGKRLCDRDNSTSAEQVLARVNMTLVHAGNYGDCMNLLKGGGVDAVPGDDLILAGFANREETLKFRVMGLAIGGMRYAVGLPKGDTRTCEPVRKAILDLYESGTAKRLMARFFGKVAFTPGRDTPERLAC
ncbi:serine/threonine-protein kinase [Acrocarpospora catenulata]|uniref:serine/threonine-protein kinase n=1 Tax=Acrocarpospora catenulata TaxID=2836182 RepID=UPI001BD93B18|nr:serine/threonine-protein kinase [Acrocarpospora catenulata]